MKRVDVKQSEKQKPLDDHLYTRHEKLLAQKATLLGRLAKLEARHSALIRTRQPRGTKDEGQDLVKTTKPNSFCPFRIDVERDVLSELGVKPFTEIAGQEQQLRMFMPHIKVEKLVVAPDRYLDDNSSLKFSFTIVLPRLFRLSLELYYVRESKVLDRIVWADGDAELTNLHLLSPQHCDAITQAYIPARRIDLIVYCLDKMAEALNIRVFTFYELRKMFGGFLYIGGAGFVLEGDETPTGSSAISAELELLLALDFQVTYDHEIQRISLQWVVDIDISRANSTERITLVAHEARTKQMKNLDLYFQQLLEPYGVVGAISIIFQRMFGIEGIVE